VELESVGAIRQCGGASDEAHAGGVPGDVNVCVFGMVSRGAEHRDDERQSAGASARGHVSPAAAAATAAADAAAAAIDVLNSRIHVECTLELRTRSL